MDQFLKALQDPETVRQMMQQTQEAVQQTAPTIPIPVVEVDPPVVMRGRLELYVTFESTSLADLSEKEIKQRVYDTLYGERSKWLPQVELGELKLWMERVRHEPESGTGAGVNQLRQRDRLPELRGVPDQGGTWDSGVGDTTSRQQWITNSDGFGPLHDYQGHAREDSSIGIGSEAESDGIGDTDTGPNGP